MLEYEANGYGVVLPTAQPSVVCTGGATTPTPGTSPTTPTQSTTTAISTTTNSGGGGSCSDVTTTCPPTCSANFQETCPQDDPNQVCKCVEYDDEDLPLEVCYCCPNGTVWSNDFALMCDDIDQCSNGDHGCDSHETCVNHHQGTNICTHGCFQLWEEVI